MLLFLDANIFFAAVASHSGGSAMIFELAKKYKVKLTTVTHILIEAERNILNKLGDNALEKHYENLLSTSPHIVSLGNVSLQAINSIRGIVPDKDIPVLMGAMLSKPDYLITLDKKDFLKNKNIHSLNLDFKISPPGEFLHEFARKNV